MPASANSASSSSSKRTHAAAVATDNRNTAGLSNAPATSSAPEEAHERMDVEDPDSESEPVDQSMIHDKGFSLQVVGIPNPSPVEMMM